MSCGQIERRLPRYRSSRAHPPQGNSGDSRSDVHLLLIDASRLIGRDAPVIGSDLAGILIVIVEARSIDRTFLARVLTSAGHSVIEASDVVEGLLLAERM